MRRCGERRTRDREANGLGTQAGQGYANEAGGKLKQGLGKVVGSNKMRAKGAAQELKGRAQVGTGKVKNAAKAGAKTVAKSLDK
jgi:uncharacterized protein YjbJ (UPF0337 family)